MSSGGPPGARWPQRSHFSTRDEGQQGCDWCRRALRGWVGGVREECNRAARVLSNLTGSAASRLPSASLLHHHQQVWISKEPEATSGGV